MPNVREGLPTGLALLVAGTFFMENLDGTILATAAPQMARSFGVQSSEIGVCLTAYLLTLAVLIPISGWLADRLGARRTYVGAIVVFTTASLLCAASTSLAELVVMRILQGIGGAMMVPVGRLVVLRAVGRQNMIRAIAYLTWPALVAPILAPAIGGVLTTYASWHWIFLINVPLGIVAALAARKLMPFTAGVSGRRLDWLGFIGSAVGLGSLMYLAALLGQPQLRSLPIVIFAVTALVIGAWTVRHLRVTPHPLLVLDILRTTTFRAAHAGGSIFRAAISAVPFLLPLMFQDGFGWTPARAGLVVLFVFVGNLAIKPLTTPMLRHFGFRATLVIATLAAMVSIAACALLTASTPVAVVAALLVAGGAFRSIGFTAYNTIAFADVEQPAMNNANTLAATIQQLAQGLGVAVAVIALRISEVFFAGTLAYRSAFVLLGILLGLAAIEAVSLPRTAGDPLRASLRTA